MRNFKKRSLIFPIFGGLAFFVLGLNLGMIVGKDMAKDEIKQQTPNKGVKTDSLDYNAIIEKLSVLESQNNPDAIGDNGLAFGVLQFHAIAVQEHNQQFNTLYTHKDAFNAEISKLMCYNLLKKGSEIHYKKCGVEANESDLVRMHNGGIYSGANKVNTLIYLQKYYEI
jgi:hypothetical protein